MISLFSSCWDFISHFFLSVSTIYNVIYKKLSVTTTLPLLVSYWKIFLCTLSFIFGHYTPFLLLLHECSHMLSFVWSIGMTKFVYICMYAHFRLARWTSWWGWVMTWPSWTRMWRLWPARWQAILGRCLRTSVTNWPRTCWPTRVSMMGGEAQDEGWCHL